MHPPRKVNCGGTTPYWVRAAQLKAVGGCSMECKDSSYQWKQPLAPILWSKRIWLITGNCWFPCCVSGKTCKAGVTSLSTKPGHKVEIPVVAHAAGFHSPQWKWTQRKSKFLDLTYAINKIIFLNIVVWNLSFYLFPTDNLLCNSGVGNFFSRWARSTEKNSLRARLKENKSVPGHSVFETLYF